MTVISGVPQGTVVGPLPFFVYSADLKKHISLSYVFYVDDFNLSCKQSIILL